MKKIALYFGSFNPPHVGHTLIANYIIIKEKIDELWFVVSPKNPLKDKASLIDSRTRIELVRKAIDDYPNMKVCDIELSLPQPSYTINTLRELGKKYPDKQFSIIMGMDNLATIHKWKESEEILKNYKIYVYPRLGSETNDYTNYKTVKIVEGVQVEISSSFIRSQIKEGKDVRFYLREKVYAMIEKEGLYRKTAKKKTDINS